jgi:hypothetical protein
VDDAEVDDRLMDVKDFVLLGVGFVAGYYIVSHYRKVGRAY